MQGHEAGRLRGGRGPLAVSWGVCLRRERAHWAAGGGGRTLWRKGSCAPLARRSVGCRLPLTVPTGSLTASLAAVCKPGAELGADLGPRWLSGSWQASESF